MGETDLPPELEALERDLARLALPELPPGAEARILGPARAATRPGPLAWLRELLDHLLGDTRWALAAAMALLLMNLALDAGAGRAPRHTPRPAPRDPALRRWARLAPSTPRPSLGLRARRDLLNQTLDG